MVFVELPWRDKKPSWGDLESVQEHQHVTWQAPTHPSNPKSELTFYKAFLPQGLLPRLRESVSGAHAYPEAMFYFLSVSSFLWAAMAGLSLCAHQRALCVAGNEHKHISKNEWTEEWTSDFTQVESRREESKHLEVMGWQFWDSRMETTHQGHKYKQRGHVQWKMKESRP